MNWKLLAVSVLFLFLVTNVFAAAPTITSLTPSPLVVTDHNYANWKSPAYMTLTAAVSGLDLNKDGCGYAIDGSWSYPTGTDLNTDTNTYTIIVQALAQDDTNWCITCKNNSAETSSPSCRTLYLDANAPTRSITTNLLSVTMSCLDVATDTGLGSGATDINYSFNGGAETLAGAATKTIDVSTAGVYNVKFSCIDALGNQNASYSSTNVTLQSLPSGSIYTGCGTLVWVAGIFSLLLCFVGLMRLIEGKMDMQSMIALAVGIMIAIYIIISITSGVCVL